MANHKSAKKRIRVAAKTRLRNRAKMSAVRTAIKNFTEAAAKGGEEAIKSFQTAQGILARAGQNGVLNRKTAARKIGRLSKLLKAK